MFEESLVESTALLRSHNRWPAVASFAAQAVVVAALVAFPMLHPEILPLRILPAALVPLPPTPPPPPPPRVPVEASTAASVPAAPAAAPPTSAPRILTPPISPTGNAPIPATLNLSAPGNGPLSSMTAGPVSSPHVVLTPTAASHGLTRISTGVSAGLLLAPIQPIYPQIAKATRTQGTVVVQAIISKTGRIKAAHAISGPLMLQGAAVEAVRDARYHPYLLNGEPTEVETSITITFRLDS